VRRGSASGSGGKAQVRRAAGLAAGLLLVWAVWLGFLISAAGQEHSTSPADVAIVLGAAVHGSRPSPVFEQRIRHGVELYRRGLVRRLLFTGGRGPRPGPAESMAARAYAMREGVPADAILTETISRTTHQNLFEARRLMRSHDLGTALIVSDPLHMKRALRMSAGLGLRAAGAPTPTSRYRSWRPKAGFLLREIYFYNVHLLTGQ
jgi:uncharacterized SAM-binding protein YcdF (DUF218 family)